MIAIKTQFSSKLEQVFILEVSVEHALGIRVAHTVSRLRLRDAFTKNKIKSCERILP